MRGKLRKEKRKGGGTRENPKLGVCCGARHGSFKRWRKKQAAQKSTLKRGERGKELILQIARKDLPGDDEQKRGSNLQPLVKVEKREGRPEKVNPKKYAHRSPPGGAPCLHTF